MRLLNARGVLALFLGCGLVTTVADKESSLLQALSVRAAHAVDVLHIYDNLGRLKATIESAETTIFAYDVVGNLLSVTRQNTSQLALIDFTPNCGAATAPVTLFGTGFSPTASQVQFNGVAASVTSATVNQIVTSVPAGATTGLITVMTPTGSTTGSDPFTVGPCAGSTVGAPTITGFTPQIGVPGTPGTPGTAVTISGTNFISIQAQNNRVLFNTTLASVASATSTSLLTSVPSPGTSGRITITTPNGQAVSTADFFVPPAPFTVAEVGATGRVAVGGSTSLTLSTANKIGLIVFDGELGKRFSLNLTNVTIGSSCCNTAEVAIYNPDGTLLVSRLNFGRDGRFVGPFTLPATGTYTILIDPTGTNKGSATLTLYEVPDNVTGTLTVNNPTPLLVTITTPGQNANLTFSGTIGQKVTVRITNNTITSSGGVFVVLNDPNGFQVTAATSANSNFNLPQQTLTATGTYSILINPFAAATGSLNIRVSSP